MLLLDFRAVCMYSHSLVKIKCISFSKKHLPSLATPKKGVKGYLGIYTYLYILYYYIITYNYNNQTLRPGMNGFNQVKFSDSKIIDISGQKTPAVNFGQRNQPVPRSPNVIAAASERSKTVSKNVHRYVYGSKPWYLWCSKIVG